MGCTDLMLLWRLSGQLHADAFDGGYGLLFDGRWNTVGRAITYCATSPSLCVLEKLIHIEDPALLPALMMLTYDAPHGLGIDAIGLDDLPDDWRHRETWTQQTGDAWHGSRPNALLRVPSVIVPLPGSPDVNVLINHDRPASARIVLRDMVPFTLDTRLF
jgi:RES domain-containing protein